MLGLEMQLPRTALSDAADRIEVLPLETTDDASVAAAVKLVADKYGSEPAPLHGICCNAGVGFGRTIADTLARGRSPAGR